MFLDLTLERLGKVVFSGLVIAGSEGQIISLLLRLKLGNVQL